MKKSQQKHSKMFDDLEIKLMEDIETRRPLTEDERADLEKLKELETAAKNKKNKQLTDHQIERLNELNRLNSYLRPGIKYPVLPRNSASVERGRKGKRFVYLGNDGDFHFGRLGKSLKVPMMKD